MKKQITNILHFFDEIHFSWKEFNPNFEFICWNKKESEKVMEEIYPDFYQKNWKNLFFEEQKNNLCKYAILKKFGGIFTDKSTICLKNLDLFLINLNKIKTKEIFISKNKWNGILDKFISKNFILNCPDLNSSTIIAKNNSTIFDQIILGVKNRIPYNLNKNIAISEIGGNRYLSTLFCDKNLIHNIEIMESKILNSDNETSGFVKNEKKIEFYGYIFDENLARFFISSFLIFIFSVVVFNIYLKFGITTLLIIIFGLIFTSIEQYATMLNCKSILEKIPNQKSLPDTGFEIIPNFRNNQIIFNLMLFLPHFLVLTLVILIFFDKETRSKTRLRNHILFGFFAIRFFRAITLHATILPSQNQGERKFDENAIFANNLTSNKLHVLKDDPDLIFSGHTAAFFFCLFWITFILNRNINKKSLFFILIFSAFYAISVVSCRYHYSIDVIVGFILTFLLCICLFQNLKYNLK